MRDAEFVGDGARIANVLSRAAAAGAADGGAMIVELERHADRFGTAGRGERGDDRTVDAARHGNDDTGAAERPCVAAFKLEFRVHRRAHSRSGRVRQKCAISH